MQTLNSNQETKSDPYTLLLLVLILLFHFPLSTGYVWDDTLLIGLNPWENSLSTLPFVWTHHLWQDIPGEHINHWYRPLMGTHILLDNILFGDAVKPKQWVSVIWFAAGMLLLRKWLVMDLKLERDQSFWIVCILIVHPFSLELTQFIAARNDTMALTFALIVTLQMKKERTWTSGFLVGGLTFLTLASKESGLIWLLLLGLPNRQRWSTYRLELLYAIGFWLMLKQLITIQSIDLHGSPMSILQTMSHSSVWSLSSTSPLQPIPTEISWIGICGIVVMVVLSKKANRLLGLTIFLTGTGLAALAAEQSNSLGFRYLWIPLMGQTIWLIRQTPKQWLLLFTLPSTYFGFQAVQSRSMWESNTTFWEAGYAEYPNQHTACGSFMQQRPSPEVALKRLQHSITSPPKLHCCAQASRYPFEIGNHSLSLSLGEKAKSNGCPSIPELLAPMAMSAAILGDWSYSMVLLAQYSSDPFGYKPLLETAYGLKQNDSTKLLQWSQPPNPALPNTTPEQRRELLRSKAEGLLEAINSSNYGTEQSH